MRKVIGGAVVSAALLLFAAPVGATVGEQPLDLAQGSHQLQLGPGAVAETWR